MSTKILLADDSITIQKVIGIIFGGEEYSLTVVDNGKAAIDKAQETVPDILLIDALMPGISGYEVCERIRAIPALAAKPILLLTGSFEPFDESKAKSCGADDFIAKPFESQQIIAKVTELCEQAAARAFAKEPSAPATAPEPAGTFMDLETTSLASQETAAKPSDIWEAFTPEEPAAETAFQPDQPTEAVPADSTTASFPWVPVDEQAFSFGDEVTMETSPIVSGPAVQESPSFGEITFAAEIEPEPVQPEADTIPPVQESPASQFFTAAETPLSHAAAPPETAKLEQAALEEAVCLEESSAPAAAAAASPMTEDQLRTALMGVSKDVIERIVWEVVPDLAETLIKEAIRQIKEGR